MSSPPATDRLTTIFDVLSASQRRYALSALLDQASSLSLESLATEVAVWEHQSPIVTDQQASTTTTQLVHRHLPRLLEADVVEKCDDETADGADDGTPRFTLADDPLLQSDWVRLLLENPRGGAGFDADTLDRTLEGLRPARRRALLRILSRRSDRIAVADLAALLVAETTADCRLVDVTDEQRTRVQCRLVHDDLPALADVGFVEHDRSSETVSLVRDAPQWRMEWLAASPVAADLDVLEQRPRGRGIERGNERCGGSDAAAGSCRTIAGGEDVVARGHDLADSATEELFVTVPDTGMLQRRCLERWRAAADRGVDIYVGSRSAEVRDLVGQAIPEATICEPQYDWLNFPTDDVHHGRVVLADRERVMLVTVDEGDDGPNTTAITGAGPTNALVKLVCEHVGPRLDRLQSQYDDERIGGQQTSPLPL
ncbi:DUF7344 domain-containing protein [Natronolimnohabitans innermongolicus]|uniref:DUF7344 domain-containing protein n=1 Tax=Natronolimnohabitans innermongolicus JCM 12255 TaxID=1227499 RepID=L9XKX0_9EURY|nr:hypothetical protein [Natronolimnohabitans innermongolicus]ELY61293.1 hypothetical protein C493_02396 [Natronolimnohabitans innermongolicus JCM 12255]